MGMMPLVPDARIDGRRDILRLCLRFKPLGTDFLLILASADLRLLDVRRLSRIHRGNQGFPLSQALDCARAANASGMIIVQERSPGDEAVPPQDFELTTAVRLILEETGIELLDYFLLVRESLVSVGGLSLDQSRKTIASEVRLGRYRPRMEPKRKPDYGNPSYWQGVSENYEFMTVDLGGRERARRKLTLLTILVVAAALAAVGIWS